MFPGGLVWLEGFGVVSMLWVAPVLCGLLFGWWVLVCCVWFLVGGFWVVVMASDYLCFSLLCGVGIIQIFGVLRRVWDLVGLFCWGFGDLVFGADLVVCGGLVCFPFLELASSSYFRVLGGGCDCVGGDPFLVCFGFGFDLIWVVMVLFWRLWWLGGFWVLALLGVVARIALVGLAGAGLVGLVSVLWEFWFWGSGFECDGLVVGCSVALRFRMRWWFWCCGVCWFMMLCVEAG